MSNTSIAAPAICLFFNTLINRNFHFQSFALSLRHQAVC
jgi:hypothetical protein